MGKTTDEIASEIGRSRDDLKSNLQELETRVKSVTDWRTQFDRHPGPLMAAALVGGMLLSAMLGGKRGP